MMKSKAKTFQIKGAETQKAAIADRVASRLKDLRQALADGSVKVPFSRAYVLRWINVSRKTLDAVYHIESAKAVEQFLLETDRTCGTIKLKRKQPPQRRSMREQLVAFAQEAEATRLRLQCEIDDLRSQLNASSKKAKTGRHRFRSIVKVHPVSSPRKAGSTPKERHHNVRHGSSSAPSVNH